MLVRLHMMSVADTMFIIVPSPGLGYEPSSKITRMGYTFKVDTPRLVTFHNKGVTCVTCGLKGMYFALEVHVASDNGRWLGNNPHLNLYAQVVGEDVLMTVDHIIPISKRGKTHLDNLQPMCTDCNRKKGDSHVSTL